MSAVLPLTATVWFIGTLLATSEESIALSVAFNNFCICSAGLCQSNAFYWVFLTSSFLLLILYFCSSAFQLKIPHMSSIWFYNLQSATLSIKVLHLKTTSGPRFSQARRLEWPSVSAEHFTSLRGNKREIFFQLLALLQGTLHSCNFHCDITSLMFGYHIYLPQ